MIKYLTSSLTLEEVVSVGGEAKRTKKRKSNV